jgi:hypothetical protein
MLRFFGGAKMTTIVRKEVRKRGIVGKLFKVLFYLFNIFMLIWLVGAWHETGKSMAGASENAIAGAGLIATGFLAVAWIMGDAILGALVLATRGSKVIVEERTE